MNTVSARAYAKINLTLYISGVKNGYHMLDSVVSSVDLCDEITVSKRADALINVTMRGEGSEAIPYGSNNAVKAAKLFIERFGCGGVDITVNKNIPMGAGLGGSSADAAGVINALSALYEISDRAALDEIADETGSDTRYMLSGGYARLKGRGDVILPISGVKGLNILLLVPLSGVSTAQCYKTFDVVGKTGGDSDAAVRALEKGDVIELSKHMHNALEVAAASLSGDVRRCVEELESLDPLAVNMTGSGSGVYALFKDKKSCCNAFGAYRGKARIFNLVTR